MRKSISPNHPRVIVVFHDHLSLSHAEDLAHCFDLYGMVAAGAAPREWTIDLFTPTLDPSMQEQLTSWERWANLRWLEEIRADSADT